jgi:FlaA1/EpsC-like NDP-sugar epimerase
MVKTTKDIVGRLLISRYVILIIDLTICLCSFLLATSLRFNFHIPAAVVAMLPATSLLVLGLRGTSFFIFKSYSGIIKYTSEKDAKRILNALLLSTTVMFAFNRHTYLFSDYIFIPLSVIVIDFVMAFFLLMAFKIGVKWSYRELAKGLFSKSTREATIIYGAGRSGLITKRAIDAENNTRMEVVAFLDDNPRLDGKMLEGVRIYTASKDFEDLVKRYTVKRAIISMQHISRERKQAFIDQCLEFDVQVMAVPPASRWLHGELQTNQIRNVKIEDLLDREPIVLRSASIRRQVEGKTILISGAAGSIGSEIVRQLTAFEPHLLVLVDQAESPLVELQLQIQEEFSFARIEAMVGDVTNQPRMDQLFSRFQPDVVFHAAAYKHVPIMERIPYEAVRVNVLGTKTLADLSVKHGVETFVMISTDKAVNPTNVMGSSKRIAEIYTQSLNSYLENTESTRFITTRFGNVLGSNGSVIPRFKRQIEMGGPITVTNPHITRYFMTIPEACQLVLEAGSMGKGGEIFIFDMGKSVRIADLAAKMIKLSGFIPGKDIEIVYTGLRPGEKINEELLADKEQTLPTHHDKIMIAQVRPASFHEVKTEIQLLLQLLEGQDDRAIVRKMKQIVPEFVSNNSVFENLDAAKTDFNLP